MGARFFWAPALVLAAQPAFAAEIAPVRLDRTAVISLAARAPSVAIAQARVEEARAARVGASVPATTNPELTVLGGPRSLAGGGTSTDLVATLSWPVDVSGSWSARREAADQALRAAEAEAADVRRNATADALDAWIEALASTQRSPCGVRSFFQNGARVLR